MPSPPRSASASSTAAVNSRSSSTRRSSSSNSSSARAPLASSPSKPALPASASSGAAASPAAAPAPAPAASRRISATPLRAPRPLEALSDALAHLGSSASALLAHHASAARSHVSAAGGATTSSPASQPAEPAAAELPPPDAAQRVAWATWQRVSEAHVFLLLGYAVGGLQMYALRGDVLEERLDIRGVLLPSEEAAGAVLAARFTHDGAQLVLACAAEQGVTLAVYDLATHAVPRATLVRCAAPPSVAAEVQLRISASYVVLAHAGKLHVHDASSLAALRTIEVSSGSALPAFDLSSRILAYATCTPPRSGTGMIAAPPGQSRLRSATSPRAAASGSSSHAAAALDAGVQLSTHAYKLGGDVLGAAKTWGNAYWASSTAATGAGGATGVDAGSPAAAGSPFSRSAPQSSGRGAGSPSSPALLPRAEPPRSSVVVLDLKRGRTLAHLTPAHRGADVRLVSLAPNADMLLTADERGHGALVFELRPGVLGREGVCWLRYRLFRGHTTASLIDATWSRSGLLTLLSARGTAHIYALRNPLVAPTNPEPPTELSVTLNAIARTRRVAEQSAPAAPAAEGLHEDVVDAALPALAMLETPSRDADDALSQDEAAAASAKTASLQLLIFEGLTAAVALHHVTLAQEALPVAPAMSPSSSSSGLTQMMRRASGMSLAMSPSASPRRPSSAATTPTAARLVAACTRAACWNDVARADDGPEVRLAFSPPALRKTGDAAPPASWISRAEITTHGGAPGPLYLSRQMVFYTYDLPPLARRRKVPIYVELHHAATSRLVVRDEVEARSFGEPHSDEAAPASFDERLASAMRLSAFDSDAARSASRSPSAHIPAFPQGGRARQPSWTSRASAGIAAIPIRAGALGMSARRGWSSGTPEKKKAAAPLLSFEESADDDAALFVAATTPASLGTNEGSLRRVGLLESASNGSSAETPPTGNESEDEWDGLRDREFQPRSLPKTSDDDEAEVKRREPSEDVVGIFGGFEEDAGAPRTTTREGAEGGKEATRKLDAAQAPQLFYSRHLAASTAATPGSMPSSFSRALPVGADKDEAAGVKSAVRPSSSAPSSDPVIIEAARPTRTSKSTQKVGKGKKG